MRNEILLKIFEFVLNGETKTGDEARQMVLNYANRMHVQIKHNKHKISLLSAYRAFLDNKRGDNNSLTDLHNAI